MHTNTTRNYAHLTLAEQSTIEQSLQEGLCFVHIAAKLHKDPSTVSLLPKNRSMKWMHLLRKAWKESNICTKSVVQIYQLSHHVEMDTAIGRIGGTALLTLTFTCCNFMVGLILPDKSATSVFAAILTLKNRLLRSGTTFVHYVPVLPD